MEQKVIKLTNLLSPLSPFLGIPSLNLSKVSYWHYSDPYLGSEFLPQRILREGSITVWYSPHEIDLASAFMTFYSPKIISYCEHPPFSLLLIFILLSPPKAYSSVFRPSFPGPTPYLEYPLAPLKKKKPQKVPKMLFLWTPLKETNFVGLPIWTLLPPWKSYCD